MTDSTKQVDEDIRTATQGTLTALGADGPIAPPTGTGVRGWLRSIYDAFTGRVPDLTGTWGYNAGASGTVVLTGSKRVIGIAAHATTAGSFTINGGDSIPVPANSSIEIQPIANLVDPTIVFTGTDSYFIERIV